MSNFSERKDIKVVQEASYARQQARAFLHRARMAKIPEQYLRINKNSFENLLCPKYHGGKEGTAKFADYIYNSPNEILKKDFVLIDGGSDNERQMAGFALLFRLILCDRWASSISCASLCRGVETVRPLDEMSREDRVNELKSFDVLFIGEFKRTLFKPGWQAGEILDEILLWRINNSNITIVSSVDPIIKDNKIGNEDSSRKMADLSVVEKTTDKVLRIKVRLTKNGN